MNQNYIKDGVSKASIINFIKNCKEKCNTEIHIFSVIRKGELLCRIAIPPYETGDNKQLYSLSKSFCSTAVGFAVCDGLFKVSDRISDIFPDKCPEVISENLSKMTVHDVLTMSTGHKNCVMGVMKESDDPVKAFLAEKLDYKPGEKFVYNTGATLLLSIIVQKYTGKTVYEYLYEKFFRFLNSCPEKWDVIPAGYCEGGVGLYASIKDIENLGKLYLGKGILNGRRFLSEEWVNIATSKLIDNYGNGSIDWCSGYGYQFWQNSKEGYRADGAFGQLCFILPSTDIIISVQCECGGAMQGEVDEVYCLAEHIEDNDKMSDNEFESMISDFYKAENCIVEEFSGFGKNYKLSENTHTLSYIEFEKDSDNIIVKLISPSCIQTIKSEIGKYTYNSIHLKHFKPTISGLIPGRNEECKFSCCLAECSKNQLVLHLRFRNSPQSEKIVFTVDENQLKIEYKCRTSSVVETVRNITGTTL